jgi:RNA polymerase sigma factor (TIGR02999 family)
MAEHPPVLHATAAKNQSAAELFPVVYDELRHLAANLLKRHAPGQTLQPTALVHEAFVKLTGSADPTSWENRQHFFAAAARAMRWILVDGQRRKNAFQRLVANGRIGTTDETSDPPLVDLIALDDALNRLAVENPSAAQLVELRYFAGLTLDEAAKTMGISRRTVIDKWSFARTCLQVMLEGGPK